MTRSVIQSVRKETKLSVQGSTKRKTFSVQKSSILQSFLKKSREQYIYAYTHRRQVHVAAKDNKYPNDKITRSDISNDAQIEPESSQEPVRWDWFNWEAYNAKFDVPWNGLRVVIGMLGWFVCSVTIILLSIFPYLQATGGAIESATAAQKLTGLVIMQTLQTATGLLVIFLTTGRWKAATWPADILHFSWKNPFQKPNGWLIWALIGAPLGLIANVLLNLLLKALGITRSGTGTIDYMLDMMLLDPLTYLLLLGVVGVMAPVLEETVFRGFLLASLTKWMPTYLAIGISSFLFALAHQTIKDLPQLMIVGSIWGLMYVRSKNLATPMILHATSNFSVLSLIYILKILGIDLSELAALLSLGARETTLSETNNLTKALAATGWSEMGHSDEQALFERIRDKQSFSLTEILLLLRPLDFDFRSRKWDDHEKELQQITKALANGTYNVPSVTLTLFLCFILPMPPSQKLGIIISTLRSRSHPAINEHEGLSKDEIIHAVPHLIAVSNAASVIMDPSWKPSSQGFGSLTFQTTQTLLSGIAETTFDMAVQDSRRLKAEDFYAYLETCAKNLSDLMLQQTLLEQEVFRTSSSVEHRAAMHFMISQSRQLLEKYVHSALDVETIMNEIWKSSVDGYRRQTLEASKAEHDVLDMTSMPETSSVCQTDSETPIQNVQGRTHRLNAHTVNNTQAMVATDAEVEQRMQASFPRQEIQNQNAFFEALGQIASDLGQRIAMVTLGRFLLFLSLLYGSGALGFVLVTHAGLSIAFSLLCTAVVTFTLAAGALYYAGKGCRQLGDEATRNISGALETSNARAAVDELVKDNTVAGLQPMVKSVVDSLVPERSHCSMIPVQTGMIRNRDSDDDQTPPPNRQNLSVSASERQRAALNRTSASVIRETAEDSVASRLRGILSTVGKIAAHFNNDAQSRRQQICSSGHSACLPPQPSSSSGLELQRQTTQERFLNAYPHMRDGLEHV